MPATDAARSAGGPGADAGQALLRRVLDFSRALRAQGLAADLAAVLDFNRALSLVDLGDRREVRAAGAALFVRRREEREPYDKVFDRFWRSAATAGSQADAAIAERTMDTEAGRRRKAERPSAGDLARRFERLVEGGQIAGRERLRRKGPPPRIT